MISFQYRAACADGSVVEGVLTGDDREHVVLQLRSLGRIPIRIDEARTEVADRRSRLRLRRRKIAEQRIADMTRELATLLGAGMPLDQALETLAELADDEPIGEVLERVRERVNQGQTLSDAMAEHEAVFSRFYVNLLRAGESGGALEVVLERLADHLDRSIEIRDALKSALVYPAVLVAVAIISVLILLVYVVPQFTEMFDSVGQVLPLSTRITIAVGELLRSYGWALAILAVLSFAYVKRQLKDARRAYRWHEWLFRVPLMGPVVIRIEVARFARTLATLLQNGIPLLKAMTIVKETMTNLVLAQGLDRVTRCLREGQGLAQPLSEVTQFPSFAVQMIKVGEESGELPNTLIRIATAYDRDTQITIKRSLALLEPMLILVLGAIIAAVIISILVAILGINELVV